MKKLLSLLVLLPSILFAQESWVRVEVQPDNYPSETTWEILDTAGTVLATNPPFVDMSLQTTIIPLDTEDYNFVIYDEFGDGICCAFGEGWFGLSNDCGLDQYVYDFGGATATIFFTLEQCAQPPPPIIGCMDPTAVNFDPEAGQNSYTGQVTPTSCNAFYPSDYNYFGIDLNYYNENQALFAIGTEISVGGYTYYIDGTSTPNNCNLGVAMIYVVSDPALADGNLFDTMQVGALVDDLYGEDSWTINPCEYIYGCNNPLAINYDPIATSDDGSCDIISGCMDPTAVNYNPAAVIEQPPGIQGPPPCQYFVLDTTSCGTDSVELIVTITVDQYASETSWFIMTNWNTDQIVMEVLEGEYGGLTMGTTVTHTACVADNTNFTFRIFDSYGDGLGGAQWGGIDGEWMVHTACDTIASGGGNFGLNAMANGNTGDCDDLPIEGCMDDNYLEYNPEAVLDNGSCLTSNVYGCIDENSINYDVEANTAEQFSNCSHTLTLTDLSENGWGGSFLIVAQGEDYYGPFTVASGEALFTTELDFNSNELIKAFFYTDPLSANFANECGFEIISPSGEVVVFGGDNPILSPIRFSPFMYSGLGQCLETCIPIVNGCTDDMACNYDPDANTLSSCTYNIEYYDCNNHCVNDTDEDGVCDENEIAGCQDPLQSNYDPTATDSGECEPFIYGCMDGTAFNYDPEANTDNGVCVDYVYGCTDPTAFNYDPLANTDNDSCVPIVIGCTNPIALNYNELANIDDFSCTLPTYGCTDSTAFNYNEFANVDNDTCIDVVIGCTDPEALNYEPNANVDNFTCILPIYGCTNSNAFNFNELANVDNNSCIDVVEGCTNPEALNYNAEANTDDLSCILPIYGCTDPLAFNYNELANIENDSCVPIVEGCTDPSAFNYDLEANTEDFSCIATIYGCTDQNAFNYTPEANTDNGSCIDTLEGCTDLAAANYNEFVNTEDGSCLYDAGCYGGPGEPYWLNDGCFAWVIDVDDYCCNNDWDASCQSMYDYCELGWPAGVDDIDSKMIVVYPNPSNDIFIVNTRLNVQIEVYDINGKKIISQTSKEISLGDYPTGIYVMTLVTDEIRISKRILKQ